MFLKVKEKQFLGKYFKYYREKNNINIYDIPNHGLCDYKTYKLIEDGGIVKSDEIYDELINFYGLHFSDFSNYEYMDQEMILLYCLIENNDFDELEKQIKKIRNQFNQFNNQIGVREYFEVLDLIEKHYIYKEYIDEKTIKEVILLIKYFNNKISSILIEICESSNWNYLFSYEIFDLLREYLNNNDLISQYWYARDLKLTMNYSQALTMYKELYHSFDMKNNTNRKIDVLLRIYAIYRDFDENEASKTTAKLESILNEESMSIDLEISIHHNLGIYYYYKKDYSKAYIHFEKAYQLSNNMKELLFVCTCLSRINKIVNYEMEIDSSSNLYPYLYYFKLKSQNINPLDLQQYICGDLIKELKKERYEEPLWSMFRFELEELVKITRNYKSYLKFQEKFHKYTKTAV